MVFDSTVILKDDAPALAQGYCVTPIVDNLERAKKDIYSLADRINNGFAASVNLYHILCGSIFDGLLFDYLSDIHVVSTSRQHASGLDYIITIYEDCPELNLFSRKLLCSYNRFTDGYRSLQSFGDSNGTRRDFYRFARLRELGAIPEEYADIRALWDNLDRENFRESLLDETQQLYEEGRCRKPYAELLNFFGYQRGGKITVPVFYKKHMDIICEIEQIVKTCVLEELKIILKEPGGNLICGSHGVPSKEIGNEIYHILFGLINEELVSRDYVCSPDELMSEGRYLKSIEFLR